MSKDKDKPQPYDSTACMAHAFFGTPGCGDAIHRVFGSKEPEPGAKTDSKVTVQDPSQSSPLFCLPHFEYTIDLRCVRGVTSIFSQQDINGRTTSDTKEYTVYSFCVDVVHQAKVLEFSQTDRQDTKVPVKGLTQVHEAQSALIQAWKDYTKATS